MPLINMWSKVAKSFIFDFSAQTFSPQNGVRSYRRVYRRGKLGRLVNRQRETRYYSVTNIGAKAHGARDQKKRLQYQGFELYGIKAFKYRVYANCLWRCFRKEESSSQPPALQKDAL